MLKSKLKSTFAKTAVAVALISSAAVSALPTGGGLYDVYHGSAWFDSGQGITVSGSTYSQCMATLANAIAYRQTNWGWSVTENNGCKLSKYKVFYQKQMAELETAFSMGEYKEKVEAVKIRKQAEADEEIQRLQTEYRYEEFRAAVEAAQGGEAAPRK